MSIANCPECDERPMAWQDYLCRDCRNRLEGRNMCDLCNKVYNPEPWKKLTWREHIGHAPRFMGLCLDCKDIAARSVPLEPEPPERAIDEHVRYMLECREASRT